MRELIENLKSMTGESVDKDYKFGTHILFGRKHKDHRPEDKQQIVIVGSLGGGFSVSIALSDEGIPRTSPRKTGYESAMQPLVLHMTGKQLDKILMKKGLRATYRSSRDMGTFTV